MSGDGGGEPPPDALVQTGDGRMVFHAAALPSRLHQLDEAAFGRVLGVCGWHDGANDASTRKAVYAAVVPIVFAMNQRPSGGEAELRKIELLARRLLAVCRTYVAVDPGARSQEPPFVLIGLTDALVAWAGREADQRKRPRGRRASSMVDGCIAELRTHAARLAGGTVSDVAMQRFIAALVQEVGGFVLPDDWLRDRRRKGGK